MVASKTRVFEARLDEQMKDQPLRFECKEDMKELTGRDVKQYKEELNMAHEGLLSEEDL